MSFESLTAPPEGTQYFNRNTREYQRFEKGEWIKFDPSHDKNSGIINGEELSDYKQRTDENWAPRCSNGCGLMQKRDYGFQCPTCLARIKPDLTQYEGR